MSFTQEMLSGPPISLEELSLWFVSPLYTSTKLLVHRPAIIYVLYILSVHSEPKYERL